MTFHSRFKSLVCLLSVLSFSQLFLRLAENVGLTVRHFWCDHKGNTFPAKRREPRSNHDRSSPDTDSSSPRSIRPHLSASPCFLYFLLQFHCSAHFHLAPFHLSQKLTRQRKKLISSSASCGTQGARGQKAWHKTSLLKSSHTSHVCVCVCVHYLFSLP